ncbi:signal recognition particle-docking protein FtsY [Halovivax cerinus]|uniref:Signal recognition particle receptor FtsY n=1 Tax=Halovivax cerinus TaxID=1487865 RepID=A0ABD5NKB9_9EURY|nr:signal recognition particle-docking protein FtsY [Halovivax cerinus]
MFDNLKEKLGSFRSEAEDVADEKAEAVDDEEVEAVDDEAAKTEVDEAAIADSSSAGDTQGSVDATSAADESSGDETAVDGRDSTEDDGASGYRAGVTTADEEASSNSAGFGRKAASLARGKFVIEEADLKGPLDQLELALLSSDVEVGVVDEIVGTMREELVGETRTFTTSTGEVVEDALRTAITDVISVGQFDVEERVAEAEKPLVIVFTGVNGVGKTTSIAKLDQWLAERGYSTVMANGDTYRAGANEQIREHAEARGTKLISHEQGGDPAAVLYDAVEYAEANGVDVVLGDTAGRLHTDEGLMDQLEKIGRVVDPDMTLFVDEAVAGQDAVKRAREFDEAVEMDGAILTKADADSNGGAAISIAQVTGKPILFLGVGQGYDDLERFDPDELADRLLAEE